MPHDNVAPEVKDAHAHLGLCVVVGAVDGRLQGVIPRVQRRERDKVHELLRRTYSAECETAKFQPMCLDLFKHGCLLSEITAKSYRNHMQISDVLICTFNSKFDFL